MEAAIAIACLLFSAFFSGIGVAFAAANKVYLGVEGQQHNFVSGILRRITANQQLFNIAMLFCNVASVVIYTCFSVEVITHWLAPFGLSPYALLFIAIAIPGLLLLVVSVFLPRIFFRIYANTLIRILVLPAYAFYILAFPFAYVSAHLSDITLKYILWVDVDGQEPASLRTDLGEYINVPQQEADESADAEIAIFRNAIGFGDKLAKDILTPRSEIAAIALSDDLPSLKAMFIATGYSKIMVYDGAPGNIIGYVHSFMLFRNPDSIPDIMIRAEEARADALIKDVLDRLTKKRKSVAVIKDEEGELAGIITVEDIIEELFGEIEDEHDEADPLELHLENGAFAFSAQLGVDYVNRIYGFALPESDAYRTLGGLVIHFWGDDPAAGDTLTVQGNVITVTAAVNKIISTVEIKPLISTEN